jgi:hypothetical protein
MSCRGKLQSGSSGAHLALSEKKTDLSCRFRRASFVVQLSGKLQMFPSIRQ